MSEHADADLLREASGGNEAVLAQLHVNHRPAAGRADVTPALRRALGRQLPLALEIAALTSFVIARPIFGSFGRSPETFVARGSDWTDVVAFGLAVALLPPLLLTAVEAALGGVAWLVTDRRRAGWVHRIAHLAVLASLLALVVWQVAGIGGRWNPRVGVLVCAAAGALLAFLRYRLTGLDLFLRYASVIVVVLLVQFLLLSPTASIVMGGRHRGVDVAAARAADAAVRQGGPPVVLVVFDGLPTELLLDGTGHIDGRLYPNLAALAGDATWYRNNTTVAQVTLQAVPAILSGQVPSPGNEPALASTYPQNIFTLLGASYDLHVYEPVTGLCPVSLCPAPAGSPVDELLGDARTIWNHQMRDTEVDPELVPHAFDERYERMDRWIDQQDFRIGGRPDLFVYHVPLPHGGWEYLADGSSYGASGRPSDLVAGFWGVWGTDVARQRHILQAQASDRLLGKLLDRMRAAGSYDDALVAVTADHGWAFTPGSPARGLDRANVDQIMWTPLIVKSPGQSAARIDDRNVNATDVLPTIADEIGMTPPWDLPGEPASRAQRDPADKWIVDWEHGSLHPHRGDRIRVDGVDGFRKVLAADPVAGTGPLAVWQRTEYGSLVGRPVAALTLGDSRPESAAVQGLDQWQGVDPEHPPLELVATAPVPLDARVAIAVNGVVAAVVQPGPTPYGVAILHALLWPGALSAGANQLGVYVVDGPADHPVLHPMKVTSA